jgi:cysteine sulfinate desulfinase/cysteine desulfurase-like protein
MGMGLRPEIVQASLRFSLCYHNTIEEIDGVVEILSDVVSRLRGLARRGHA